MSLDEIKTTDLIRYARETWGLRCNEKGVAHCPFHQPDNNPSFSIYRSDEGVYRWKDHHDGGSGTIVDLKARMEGKTTEEAIRELLEEFGSNSPRGTAYPPRVVRSHVYKDKAGTVVFRKDKLSDGKYVWYRREGDRWEKGRGGQPHIPYNLDRFEGEKIVVVCEGEKDADTVTSVSGGALLATSAPNGKGSIPDDIIPYFSQFIDIFFLYDVGNDEDVRNHARKLHGAHPSARAFLARVPLDRKEADITEYIESLGPEKQYDALQEVLLGAAPISLDTVKPARQEGGQTPILINLSTVKPEVLDWLWPGRIPVGKVSIIAGLPGQGKSFFSLFMAAQVTTGSPFPDAPQQPTRKGSVIILSAEDGIADTIRPRAEAMGADISKIEILDGVGTKKDEREFFDLSRHIPALRTALENHPDCRLLIIDPISAYTGSVDNHSNAQVRKILNPLVSLTAEYRVAVVCITHLNKAEGFSAMSRVMDSLAFVATARTVWLIGADPHDPEGKRKLLGLLKANLIGRTKGLAFMIMDDSRLVFESEEVDVNTSDLLGTGSVGVPPTLEAAKALVTRLLSDGRVPSEEVFEQGRREGISTRTLQRARRELGIRALKEGFGQSGQWFWEPPAKEEDQALNAAPQN